MEITFHPSNQRVLDALAQRELDSKEWYDLKTAAEHLALTDGFERLLSLEVLDLTLYEHQERAVLKVLREMGGRAVLADEVGLGKTVEAGVILKEYVMRALVKRVLVLTPASLVDQWRLELQQKIGINCRVGRNVKDFRSSSFVLASIDTAKREPYRQAVQKRQWDMVIVDEAHRLKNQSTLNWRFVNGIQKKFLLLLTATPIQNDLRELYNLITLLKPGQLKTYSQFKKAYMLDKRSPKNTDRLRERLTEVMVRTHRGETLIPFPKRNVSSISVDLSPKERSFYQRVLNELRRAYQAMPKDDRNILPLILVLREACSHPKAAGRTLIGMARRGTLPTLSEESAAELLKEADGLPCAKTLTLLDTIRTSGDDRHIVFTEFRLTQAELIKALEKEGVRAFAFHGGLTPTEKEVVVQAFKDEASVLVSTEAGGEGRNLQFCRSVINYDLPWNPMRVEQRIGRVHRLGQERDVMVTNIVTQGTIDAYVLYLLDQKIDMFNKVIGEIDAILANLDRGFEVVLADAALGSNDEEELRRRVEAFGQELERAYRSYERVRRLNAQLFNSPGIREVPHGDESGGP